MGGGGSNWHPPPRLPTLKPCRFLKPGKKTVLIQLGWNFSAKNGVVNQKNPQKRHFLTPS